MASSSAWGADYLLEFTPDAQQIERMEQGRRIVDSPGARATVRVVQQKSPTSKRPGFRVFVSNNSERPFNFGPDNLGVRMADGVMVPMVTYDTLAREEHRREGWQRFAAAMAAAGRASSAANAGNVQGTATYNGSTFGTFGSTPYNEQTHGTATYQTYDPARAQIAQSLAQQQNNREAIALEAAQAANMQALDVILQTTTVDPGSAFGGIILFDPPKSVKTSREPLPVVVVVTIDGEEHLFPAKVGKAK
jgi:hypothetical protein